MLFCIHGKLLYTCAGTGGTLAASYMHFALESGQIYFSRMVLLFEPQMRYTAIQIKSAKYFQPGKQGLPAAEPPVLHLYIQTKRHKAARF